MIAYRVVYIDSYIGTVSALLCSIFRLQASTEFTGQGFGSGREKEIKATTTRKGDG